MKIDSKTISILVEKLENRSQETSIDCSENTTASATVQTVGMRYHHFIIDIRGLKLGKVAEYINLDPAILLEAAIGMAVGKNSSAWDTMCLMVDKFVPANEVDKYATLLDSWYCSSKSYLERMFAFLTNYASIAEVLVEGDIALIEVAEEYDLPGFKEIGDV